VLYRGCPDRCVSIRIECWRVAITAEVRSSIGVQRRTMAGKPVAMYRKRALTVETGPRREVRYRGPAAEMRPTADMGTAEMRATAAETRPATDVSAAEVGCATAEMRRSAHTHTAAEVASAAADMRCATATAMKSATATAMKSATATGVKSATAATMKSAASAAAPSGTRVGGSCESGHQSDSREGPDSRDFGV
jgi:hypothetical protein